MYTISEIVDLGEAHRIILSDIKDLSLIDDSQPMSLSCEEMFDS